MAWARISDDFLDHQKVAELTVDIEGMAAMGLWTLALCWVRADRRRRGVVPTGIAMRLSAGHGKQLASRLVHVGLWDEVEGGFYFHDYDDVYTPGDLSEKRAEAGRSGGKASGQVRAVKAASKQPEPPPTQEPKQLASGESATKRTAGGANAPSLFDDDDPLTAGSTPSTDRSNDEAKAKQLASDDEAKRREASRARAGATTHSPEASNEASPFPPQKPRGDRGTRLPEDWQPDAELLNWAKAKYPRVDLEEQTERFRNYWLAKTGKDATKLDWRRTWQNWISEANSRIRFPSNGGYPQRPESNAPKPIPVAERCPKHPSFKAATCGPCRSDQLAGQRG